MTKPKGKTPSLISKSNGKPYSHCYKRNTKCTRCNSDIASSQMCFLIPKDGGGFINEKPFCLICFRLILEKTKEDVAELEKELSRLQTK
jgi:hypothetical protein